MFLLRLILEPEKFLYYKNNTDVSVNFSSNLLDAHYFTTRSSAIFEYEMLKKRHGIKFDLQCIEFNFIEVK